MTQFELSQYISKGNSKDVIVTHLNNLIGNFVRSSYLRKWMSRLIKILPQKQRFSDTRIMINKGMANKGKYWIFEKNKGAPVSYFGDLKGTHKGFQYSILPFFSIKYN